MSDKKIFSEDEYLKIIEELMKQNKYLTLSHFSPALYNPLNRRLLQDPRRHKDFSAFVEFFEFEAPAWQEPLDMQRRVLPEIMIFTGLKNIHTGLAIAAAMRAGYQIEVINADAPTPKYIISPPRSEGEDELPV